MKKEGFYHLDLSAFEILALDLEGTLISNATSQIPAEGLYGFLEFCKSEFEKIVMFTSIPENRFRQISSKLKSCGHVPGWFVTLECVKWNPAEELKDLRKIDENWKKVLIIDDVEAYIRPEQRCNWLRAEPDFKNIGF